MDHRRISQLRSSSVLMNSQKNERGSSGHFRSNKSDRHLLASNARSLARRPIEQREAEGGKGREGEERRGGGVCSVKLPIDWAGQLHRCVIITAGVGLPPKSIRSMHPRNTLDPFPGAVIQYAQGKRLVA